jgi:hypothetical protein
MVCNGNTRQEKERGGRAKRERERQDGLQKLEGVCGVKKARNHRFGLGNKRTMMEAGKQGIKKYSKQSEMVYS